MNYMNLQTTDEQRPEEILDMQCDKTKPFAFISYAHKDATKVREIFINLYSKGYNLWIDAANLPHDQNSWAKSARSAYLNSNCKCAFFFRSENSVISEAVERELENIHSFGKPISSIDIWTSSSKTMYKDYNKELLTRIADSEEGSEEFNKANNDIDIYEKIVSIIDYNCNAIQGSIEKIMSDMIRDYKSYVGDIITTTNPTTTSTVTLTYGNKDVSDSTTKPKMILPSNANIESLHGAHTVQELIMRYDNKTFTAKLYHTIGMRVANRPQYDIAPCKNLCQLLQAFVGACIQEYGENYIQMVNSKNLLKNPVFIPSAEADNYKVRYGALNALPSWSMNINFNPYGYLKNLESRLLEIGIHPSEAELIFDEDVAVPSVEKTTAPVAKSTAQPTSFNEPQGLRDAMYQWMDSYASHEGAMNGEHPLYQLICNKIPFLLTAVPFMQQEYYTSKGSCGQGNWAGCPWIAIFNTNITNTTTKGVYIVYLLNAENKTLYLTLNQGMTEIQEKANDLSKGNKNYFKEHGYRGKDDYTISTLKINSTLIRNKIGLNGFSAEDINSGKKEYDAGCICSKKYTLDTLSSDEELYHDLKDMLDLYDKYYEVNK